MSARDFLAAFVGFISCIVATSAVGITLLAIGANEPQYPRLTVAFGWGIGLAVGFLVYSRLRGPSNPT